MGLFRRRPAASPSSEQPPRIDHDLDDATWWRESEALYDATWRGSAGSPETFAETAKWHYGWQNVGVALLFHRKSIDLLHSLYLDGFARRQPGPADLPLLTEFVSSLAVTLDMHPGAPVDKSVQEVTHRLRDIARVCRTHGVPAAPFVSAEADVAHAAPRVDLSRVLG